MNRSTPADSYHDVLYGEIELPSYLRPFVRLPEFLRLRHVRLSNVDSVEYKDFGTVGRWEHGIAAAFLAGISSDAMLLAPSTRAQLQIAALLHDVATPPFAHTAEAVLDGFDHAEETRNLFNGRITGYSDSTFPIFAGQPSRFRAACAQLQRSTNMRIDPDEIASWITGEGDLGYLIASYVDLDNIDNVTRASHLMGLRVDAEVPKRLAAILGESGHPLSRSDSSRLADLAEWESYRDRLYRTFFLAGHEERARQSWLQTLMRRSIHVGLPRTRLIWNTDDGLLADAEQIGSELDSQLHHLVLDYRLHRPSTCVASVDIFDDALARRVAQPRFVRWLEGVLGGEDCLTSVNVARRRVSIPSDNLLGTPDAILRVFVFDPVPNRFFERRVPILEALANVGTSGPRKASQGERFRVALKRVIETAVPSASPDKAGVDTAIELAAVGDWSFRGRRNTTFFQYPATWLHEIPANLIRALALGGAQILDPFGGTGETAVEAIRHGSRMRSIDNNRIACLIARVRTTYLSSDQIARLYSIVEDPISIAVGSDPTVPTAELERWYHEATLDEMGSIRAGLADILDEPVRNFLTASFAGIANSCSSRRGMSFGHFADNTPIGRDKAKHIDYVNAWLRFSERLRRNLVAYEAVLGQVERYEVNPAELYGRVEIVHGDSTGDSVWPGEGTVNGIITSPPYLGMIDYALSQRLPYYWLDLDGLDGDYSNEVGTRRSRNRDDSVTRYRDFLEGFAVRSSRALAPGGYVAAVIGNSTANRFEDLDFAIELGTYLGEAGLKVLWSHDREVSAHRIHNLHRLKHETILVAQKPS